MNFIRNIIYSDIKISFAGLYEKVRISGQQLDYTLMNSIMVMIYENA